MFKFEPLTVANVISLIQLLAVIGGFYFSWRSLNAAAKSIAIATESLGLGARTLTLSTSNAQAQLFNQMVVQGRDLQFKAMEVFHPGSTPDELAAKRKQYTGTVIGYYASCFELRNVLTLPAQVSKLLDEELREIMREKAVRDKWDEVKHLHSQAFVQYVESSRGIK